MSRARTLADQFNSDGKFALTPVASVNAGQIGGRRNLIINGAMQVAQRSSGPITVSDNSNEGYSTLDRWFLNFNAGPGGALDFSQSTDAPDGFANSIKLACSTADATHTGTEQIYLVQYIEAQNLQQLAYGSSNAKSFTISWYMKAVNFSSPISFALETVDGTEEYFAVSVTPTSSWARYSVTIPGSSSATINNDNGVGLRLKFVLAGSSSGTYVASSDSTAWSTTRVDYIDDIGNLVSSTSNEFYITGVQLELGSQATDFEHRSFGEELALCQRYYEKSFRLGTVPANGSSSTTLLDNAGAFGGISRNRNSMATSCTFVVAKRTAPTMIKYGNSSGNWIYSTLNGSDINQSINIGPSGISEFGFYGDQQAVDQTSLHVKGHWVADAEL